MNEKADKAASEAAKETDAQMILPISLGGLLRHTRSLFNQRRVVSIQPFKTKGRKVAEALNNLQKGEAAAIFQLRCGHCPLKKFLHRIDREDTDRCEECHAKETTAHYLIYCKKYKHQRQIFRRKLKEEGIKVNINSAVDLLDTPKLFPYLAEFIQDTGRFPHLKRYVDTQPPDDT